MKKILLTIFLTIALLSSNANAQIPTAFSVHGGYSWINGVAGAEIQFGRVGISGGWMPTSMPMSGTPVNSYGMAFTAYTGFYDETSWYTSIGFASQGFRYEDSWGYEATSPMTIFMVGIKTGTPTFNVKLGGGYGWCEYGDAWTFEATIGFVLFKNKQ